MKIARKVVTLLIVAVLVCVLPVTAALAAESGSLWAAIEHSENTTVLVVADTAVTDGVVKLTYDSAVLTYESVEVAEEYVAMHAVNAQETGTVLISWVAPGAYTLDSGAVCLFRVNFTGVEDSDMLTLTGTAHDANGGELTFADAPDLSGLTETVGEAEKLDADKYTNDSYAAVEQALTEAKSVAADSTATQAEVDAAEKALKDAMDGLVKASGGSGSQESTNPKPTEGSGDNADTGDGSNIWLFVVIAVVSAAAIVVLLIKMRVKKGGDAK